MQAQGEFDAQCHYDALGRRSRKAVRYKGKTEQTTRFLWQGYRLLQEQRDDGSRRSWSYDPASPWSPLAALEQAGDSHSADIYWYHTDLNSAPLEVTDAAGNLCWSGQYDICFPDPKSRLSSFFIWNEGDGKFLSYSLQKGKCQALRVAIFLICMTIFLPVSEFQFFQKELRLYLNARFRLRCYSMNVR